MNEEAVSDVVGNILLVGITVGLMSGMSVAVLMLGGAEEVLHADLAVDVRRGGDAWGEGDEEVRVRHVGGEPVPAGARVTVVVDDVGTTYTPDDQGFSDGELRLGESWTLTTTIPEGAEVAVTVVDPGTNAILAATGLLRDTAGGSGASTFTYVFSGSATSGTLTGFADAQSAADAGASARLTEASSPGTTPVVGTLDPGAVTSSTGATSPGSVLQEDDVRAAFTDAGDRVEVEGFSLPADATVTGVVVGFEAQRSGGGAASAQLTLSYTVGGVAGPSSLPVAVSTTGDTQYTLDVGADRNWTAQDVADLHLLLDRDSIDAGFRDADVDHVFATVTYTLPVTELDATFDFQDVPSTGTHRLQVRYATAGDSFEVLAWDEGTLSWNSLGTLDSASPATLTHVLTPDEHNGGQPRLWFRDLDSGTGAGTLDVDYARVVSG